MKRILIADGVVWRMASAAAPCPPPLSEEAEIVMFGKMAGRVHPAESFANCGILPFITSGIS